MDDTVFAVELKAGGRVVRLAHTHSLVDENQEHDYWAEPQVSVNPDFTWVVFTTNWGRSGTDVVETFMIALPPDSTELLPYKWRCPQACIFPSLSCVSSFWRSDRHKEIA